MEKKYLQISGFTSYDWDRNTHQASYYEDLTINSYGLGYFLDKKDKQQLINIKNKNSNNRLLDNTSICLTKFSTLPKYKLKNYIEENKLKISQCRLNKSPNSIVVNFDHLIDEYFKYSSREYYVISSKSLYDYISLDKTIKANTNSDHKIRLDAEILNNLKEYTYLYDTHSYDLENLKQVNYALYREVLNCPKISGWLVTNSWGSKTGCENVDLLRDILDDKYHIICDSTINKDINSGTVIDIDLFKTLLGMSSSSDTSNLLLAKEIIANSELEASKPYILFLLWSNESMRKIDNNANYKFCLDQLKEFKRLYHDTHLETFIPGVLNKIPEHKQAIFDCFAAYINHRTNQELIKQLTVS